ncbi:MAG: hypothetical protein K0R23_1679 [Lacrimispora sp.]|nr:hypothetical protein [Lacrimispora sp.]
MVVSYIILIIMALLVYRGIFAVFMNKAAMVKGYGEEAHAIALCLFFGIMGCLYIIALPDRKLKSQNDEIIQLLQSIMEKSDNKDV